MASSEVFTKDDIKNYLRGAMIILNEHPISNNDALDSVAYRHGVATGIAAVAVAFGIDADAILKILKDGAR